MFKIDKLVLYGKNDERYVYQFETGLNYIKGGNSSGKTEFYGFIDYMLGSSEKVGEKECFNGTLYKASMYIEVDGVTYVLTRVLNSSTNYLHCVDETSPEAIDLRVYKEKINAIFAKDKNSLKEIRSFADEELTYRAFTMFNFFGEKRQGNIQDFFDKCDNIKYSIKVAPILNFIFNKNLEEIHELQERLAELIEQEKRYEASTTKYDFVIAQVNKAIQKLGINEFYTGNNAEEIRKYIADIKNMQEFEKKKVKRNIVELEAMYSNINEQIKVYENAIMDAKQFKAENQNRKILLDELDELLSTNENFTYLVEPLKHLMSELDNTIAFSQYTISDDTVKELKKQRKIIKMELRRNDARFKCFSMEEKAKAVALVEEYLATDIRLCDKDLRELRKEIREIKERVRILQNSDDAQKIRELSQCITDLYSSARGISSVVDEDLKKEGFKIKYYKKGNILQPTIQIIEEDDNGETIRRDENYYTGSLARHTLIQLCGYFGFWRLMLEEEKYPLVPILVIDHISKPFDERNAKAIGAIIASAYNLIGKDKLQIFMFDDEDYNSLQVEPDHEENLVTDIKSGFNPFFVQTEEAEVVKRK